MKEILKFRDISLKNRKRQLIKNVNISVNKGEVIGIVSDENESRNSIIKCICGIINDYKGQILIGGHDIKKQRERALKNVSLLSRTPMFYEYMTIEENIKLFNKFYRNISQATIEEKLKVVGLYNRRKEKCRKLSNLTKNKLSFIYVLLSIPRLILVDDFFQDIDEETKEAIEDFIKKEKQDSGVSFVISDKDIEIMERLCDTIIFIKKGEIIEQCMVDDITENYPSIKDYKNEIMKREL